MKEKDRPADNTKENAVDSASINLVQFHAIRFPQEHSIYCEAMQHPSLANQRLLDDLPLGILPTIEHSVLDPELSPNNKAKNIMKVFKYVQPALVRYISDDKPFVVRTFFETHEVVKRFRESIIETSFHTEVEDILPNDDVLLEMYSSGIQSKLPLLRRFISNCTIRYPASEIARLREQKAILDNQISRN